jgi:hypothetical protein
MVRLGLVATHHALAAIVEGIKGHGVAHDRLALILAKQVKGL